MEKEKKKEISTKIMDRPVPPISAQSQSIVRLSDDQMKSLAEHFVDSSLHEMY